MHSSGENTSGNVPAFLMKVWTIVEDPAHDELIYWDPSGKSFHVFDQQRFSREILPLYFKHNNIASFIRQLNMYGFRKVAHIDQGGLKIENDDLHFQHPYFQREEKELLQHIKRKVSSTQTIRSDALTAMKNDEVSRVLTDVNQIKGRQQDTEQSLDYIRRENKQLWREIASLRQKHHKQQEIVNKLIQFLVSLVRSNRTDLTIPLRRGPLAIDSSLGNAVGNSNIQDPMVHTQAYNIESPKAGEIIPLATPNSGPIIHELHDTSPQFINDRYASPLRISESPVELQSNNNLNSEVDSTHNPVLVMLDSSNPSSVVPITANLPLPSPRIEIAPTLEDALNFDWTNSAASTAASSNNQNPTELFLAPETPSSASQGKNQKRKRPKPQSSTVIPESSPTKKLNSASHSTLNTPDIFTGGDEANALGLLVNNTISDNLKSDSVGLSSVKQELNDLNSSNDDSLAVLASNTNTDDLSVNSNQLDFSSSDLDGLRGLLQEQYKLDPTVLFELFESVSPWPILSEKPLEDEDNGGQPSTSAANIDDNNIIEDISFIL